jgi:hypothetical protein
LEDEGAESGTRDEGGLGVVVESVLEASCSDFRGVTSGVELGAVDVFVESSVVDGFMVSVVDGGENVSVVEGLLDWTSVESEEQHDISFVQVEYSESSCGSSTSKFPDHVPRFPLS